MRADGFTLIELMAVALLTALLSSLGLISAVKTYQRWSIEENAERFFLTARYARVYAIEHQQPCLLVIDAAQKQYFLSVPNDLEPSAEAPMIVQNLWAKRETLAPYVQFETIRKDAVDSSAAENQITFRPDGTAESAGIQIGDGKTHYSIVISTAGRTRVLSGPLQEVEPDQVDLDMIE